MLIDDVYYDGEYEYLTDNNCNLWRKIPSFPDYYANDDGYIASVTGGYLHRLKPWPNQHGHLYVQLSSMGYHKKMSVHRIIAETFIPNPNNYPIVRHLDDDPTNNCVENLAWGTQADNVRDCRKNGNMYMRPVYCFETNTTYESCADAAEDIGVCRSLITQACNGSANSIKDKYHFCYLEDVKMKRNDKKWLNKYGNLKPIIAKNTKTGEELYFSSRNEAAEKLNMPACGISSVISGHISSTHGWKFKEAM